MEGLNRWDVTAEESPEAGHGAGNAQFPEGIPDFVWDLGGLVGCGVE